MKRTELYDDFFKHCVNMEDCSECECNCDNPSDVLGCALMFGYYKGVREFSQSEEYAEALNEAYNRGIEIGKTNGVKEYAKALRSIGIVDNKIDDYKMIEYFINKGRTDAIEECIEIVSRETHDGTLCDYLEALKEQK